MARGRTTMRGTKAMSHGPGKTTMRGTKAMSHGPSKTTISGSDPSFGRKAESGSVERSQNRLPGKPY